MATKKKDIIMQNKIFLWIAVGTGLILLIPLIMMQISSEWDWELPDFIIIGVLLFGMGNLFVFAARKMPKRKIILGLGFLLATLYIWAELAVGIFTNLGS